MSMREKRVTIAAAIFSITMLLTMKKVFRKMREKALHVGSNIYGGRKDGIKV